MENGGDRRLQRTVLGLIALGLAGSLADLAFLGHVDGAAQLIPFGSIILALAAVGWHRTAGTAVSARGLKVAMSVLFVTGILGLWFHYSGNREFQLESNANQHGFPLLFKILHAKAPPALAPSSLCLLSLFGFATARTKTN